MQFNSVFERNNTNIYISRRYYQYDNIIYQPILSYIFYYNNKKSRGAEYNTALWDKLIKREVALKAFNFIGKEYIKEKIIIENDVIILFSLDFVRLYINSKIKFYLLIHFRWTWKPLKMIVIYQKKFWIFLKQEQ